MRISDWSSDVCSSDLALVMTPQLQQAIKLLQLSNLELMAYVEQELERNPLLERGEAEEGGAGDDEKAPFEVSEAADGAEGRLDLSADGATGEIGRASGRERVCQYV